LEDYMPPTWDPEFERLMREVLRLLPPDEPLWPALDTADAGLDSLAVVELLLSIEDAYEISIPDDLLQHQTFATPEALWKVVSDLRGSSDSQPGGA
jgi:acyl carrier protein